MISVFLSFLLALSQPAHLPQTNVVNEAIKIEQVQNSSQSLGIKITAKSALVVDAESNKIVFQKNSQEILPIASLTKLMTALLVSDLHPDWQVEAEYVNEDNVTSTISQSNKEPSQINFKPGEKIKIENLLASGLIRSANNAIKTLVRYTNSGEEKHFVERMNQRTQELGMLKTLYVEPTGLDSQNVSTAEDLVKLMQQIGKKPEITKFLSVRYYSFKTADSDGRIRFYQIRNANKLFGSFVKVVAAKTGYLDEADYCFAGTVEYNKKKFIIVLLGSQSETDRLQEVKGLAWWAANHGEEIK